MLLLIKYEIYKREKLRQDYQLFNTDASFDVDTGNSVVAGILRNFYGRIPRIHIKFTDPQRPRSPYPHQMMHQC
ncbi:hypothetical protein CASFOL_014760 [Castilleja foliolosa]|uniref:Uncharacterized protein n=1 Tax=Castilleja foliolosa TaxID=1961234 RepID=A0ABD3DCR2_9LAMI